IDIEKLDGDVTTYPCTKNLYINQIYCICNIKKNALIVIATTTYCGRINISLTTHRCLSFYKHFCRPIGSSKCQLRRSKGCTYTHTVTRYCIIIPENLSTQTTITNSLQDNTAFTNYRSGGRC